MLVPAALVIALVAASWLVRTHLRLPGKGRDAAYATAAVKQVAGFAVPALAALLLIGRGGALVVMPGEFVVAGWTGDAADLLPALAVGVAGGTVIGALLARRRWRRTGRRGPVLGEIGWLNPRNRRELGWTTLLAVLAGVSEEMFFRLVLPLLATLATGSLLAGQLVALAIFGAAHRYQGPAGVLATTALGAVFAALYLASGSLWLAILAHVLVDLNSLVIRPAVTGAWRRD
ncbi:CPBP family intramembrane metalloprotease [Sphingomonas sp. SUN019]|uniref:CPBP family intramembrane glutamic endopeptidase n=1 Tax=Sphingomonas sp. SUN019 TaxID=2937788 RepID=UPI0021643AA1|nr:CPBP family intramembrane glutamic endopeptidase [Sphingomonas sp. SUN019]UVO51976.1 CPBP family intramembrane metalloprotease [Sphingomonas sp. SUN019]